MQNNTLYIGKNFINPEIPEGQTALEQVYGQTAPVTCKCNAQNSLMYVAKINDKYVVKRMPGTASYHAPSCPAFEAPEHLSGLGELTNGAIIEDPETGKTNLTLDFPLSKKGKRNVAVSNAGGTATEAVSNPKKLGLTALLHYLWTEAELTKWVPAMEQKRWWGVVGWHLLISAKNAKAKGFMLRNRLFIPEYFRIDNADEILKKQNDRLLKITESVDGNKPVGILIAEYKSHEETMIGSKFYFLHAAKQPFFADRDLTKRFNKIFEDHLMLASAKKKSKIIMIATFTGTDKGYYLLDQIGLMVVNENWIPFENVKEFELIEHLIKTKRRFIKQLRFNLKPIDIISTAVLNDVDPATALYVLAPTASHEDVNKLSSIVEEVEFKSWVWLDEPEMPPLDGSKIIREQGVLL